MFNISFIHFRALYHRKWLPLTVNYQAIYVALSPREPKRKYMEQYSLNELGTQVEKEDVLLECSITVHADVSLERPHKYEKDEEGKLKLVLGNGWLVSLSLPARVTLPPGSPPLADGEQQVVADLQYQSEDGNTISLEDVLKALGIDKDAKIWRVREAS
jgi:hypothetical protein